MFYAVYMTDHEYQTRISHFFNTRQEAFVCMREKYEKLNKSKKFKMTTYTHSGFSYVGEDGQAVMITIESR